jgi:hypothetical protein
MRPLPLPDQTSSALADAEGIYTSDYQAILEDDEEQPPPPAKKRPAL